MDIEHDPTWTGLDQDPPEHRLLRARLEVADLPDVYPQEWEHAIQAV